MFSSGVSLNVNDVHYNATGSQLRQGEAGMLSRNGRILTLSVLFPPMRGKGWGENSSG
ncbi:MAG: hypothetical protein WCS94_02960 [Verrucomicrobiota bacterium]